MLTRYGAIKRRCPLWTGLLTDSWPGGRVDIVQHTDKDFFPCFLRGNPIKMNARLTGLELKSCKELVHLLPYGILMNWKHANVRKTLHPVVAIEAKGNQADMKDDNDTLVLLLAWWKVDVLIFKISISYLCLPHCIDIKLLGIVLEKNCLMYHLYMGEEWENEIAG